MKIKKMAQTTLVPAVVVGVTVSGWAAVEAATGDPRARAAAHEVHEARPVHPARASGRPAARHLARGGSRTHPGATRKVPPGRDRAGRSTVARADRRSHAEAASRPAQAAPSSTSLLSGMSAFERCVAWRESGDNPAASSAGLFGILPSTWASLGYPGTAGGSSVALQKAAFNRLYAQYGTSPWAPYDGC